MPTDRDLFQSALDQPDTTARTEYLLANAPDEVQRARVEKLLAAHADAGGFLEVPPEDANVTRTGDGGVAPSFDRQSHDEHLGVILDGKYKLVEEIGEGGMGSVYMAQQMEPVKRTVAVKVIKAGMDSKAVLARFEAERQALAMMDHPNIARVLDAGTTDSGRPYFVMELVKGIPITEFCDQRKLTPRQRLELFVPVCQAIQHAHQKGIIHRDIKPGNVLVALYDDRPVPKVIDFGIAKAAGQTLTDKTLMTGFGAVVGTPEYMSPEQASLNNLDIDTRSDVYALGVLLYELLTGTTPVDRKSLGKAALLEILRIVREDEAPRPSAKVSTLDTLPSVAANRGTEPAKLSRLMRGELDWVLLKALEKDRTRRYESANGFAADVLRYLSGEVVQAHPPSAGYRLRKFVRRNRGQVIAAGLVFCALLIGLVTTVHQAGRASVAEKEAWENARRAEHRRAEAERAEGISQAQALRADDALLKTRRQAEIAEAVKNFLEQDLIAQVNPLDFGRDHPKPDPELKLKTALDRAVPLIAERFKGKPLIEASIRHAIGKAYYGRGLYPEAQKQLEMACERYRVELTRTNPAEVDHLVRAPYTRALFDLFQLWNSQGKTEQALDTVRLLEEQIRAEFGDSDLGRTMQEGMDNLRSILTAKDAKGANDVLAKNQDFMRKWLPDRSPMDPRGQSAEARAQSQKTRDAEDRVRAAMAGANEVTAAVALYSSGKYPEAEIAVRRLIEPRRAKGGVEVFVLTSLLAEVYRLQGKYPEARTSYETSRDGIKKLLGEDHPSLGACHHGLSQTLLAEKKYSLAEAEIRAAMAFYERRTPEDLIRFELKGLLGVSLMGQQKYPAAEVALLAAYEGWSSRVSKTPELAIRIPEALDRLIELYTAMKKPDEVKKYRDLRAKYPMPMEVAPKPKGAK